MLVTVNGKKEILAASISLPDYVRSKGLAVDAFVFMLNDRVLPRSELKGIVLQENDRLEILSFLGGG